MERETGFEPATPCLEGRNSTAELLPQKHYLKAKSSQKFTSQLLNDFITSRASGTSQKTMEIYHLALDRFVGYSLTPEGINSYLNSLTCGNAKHNYFRCIRTLCRWLYQNDYIASNPIEKVSPPKRQRKLLPAIGKEQLQTLLEHCEAHENSERDKAILNLLWYSGMRLSEVANVKAEDFDWDKGTVIVLGKGNKYRKALAGNGEVKQWFATHDSFEVTAKGIQTMLQRLAKESGIHCNPHSFRRGFCVHQVKSGLSTRVVQALGGWEQLTMVEHYSKSLSFDDALDVYHKVNSI